MKYTTILELDNRIERIIKSTVKSYYTDWKNYDRPKYMKLKGSPGKCDKSIILLARECGTYIFSKSDLDYSISLGEETNKKKLTSLTILEYYFNQERSSTHFYYINLNNLECRKLKDEEITKLLKDCNKKMRDIAA